MSVEKVHEVIESLHEFNPMMGHRGCRLTVTYPEIAEMQTTAVINAAINVQKKGREGYPADHDPAGRRGQGVRLREEDRCRYGGQDHCRLRR